MKILLWKIGALGDILMTTPLVRQLRRTLPEASIDYLTGQRCAAVLAGNPHVDRVLTFDEAILYGGQAARVPQVLPLLRGYDLVFTLDKHWIFPLLARLAGVRRRVGFRRRPHEGLLLTDKVRYGALRHEVDCYLDLLEAAGQPVARADVALDGPVEEAFACAPGATVLVNSGGDNANERSAVRRMPDALFGALVEACAAQGPVQFLGAPSESAYYDRFAGAGRTNLCGRTRLPQALSALRQAKRVVTTDTGLMHLAATANARVTAVFGPT
ncbi:MAG TPA: glycosyltransferase family 9 protein, partial [Ramlibacter sp.]|nr:glycosyltransferase family 9 protein [Ramlibacter sp.]